MQSHPSTPQNDVWVGIHDRTAVLRARRLFPVPEAATPDTFFIHGLGSFLVAHVILSLSFYLRLSAAGRGARHTCHSL